MVFGVGNRRVGKAREVNYGRGDVRTANGCTGGGDHTE